ncbi:type II toxin-antitoxin system RelE/ParE family toxin [Hoylesella oralis]|uniref:type II toxin-antitoxin system RelE/ParE family toxin n=1 Tax=Hoylesella oralis TaxID=28134 RepID=UPI0028EB53E2|nr:type II toxin-antitoxin system RelE/ParE family toxin [Hoylesella oralis]
MEKKIREVSFSEDFVDFLSHLNFKVANKYDYVIRIIETKYVISEKFVKHLENTDFYEMRVSLSSNEYRTVLFTVDADSFIESKKVLLLNSFLKKDSRQYRAEIRKAENLLDQLRNKYAEDK